MGLMSEEDIRYLNAVTPDLVVCPVCHNQTLQITKKKKIKFCFYCGRDIDKGKNYA